VSPPRTTYTTVSGVTVPPRDRTRGIRRAAGQSIRRLVAARAETCRTRTGPDRSRCAARSAGDTPDPHHRVRSTRSSRPDGEENSGHGGVSTGIDLLPPVRMPGDVGGVAGFEGPTGVRRSMVASGSSVATSGGPVTTSGDLVATSGDSVATSGGVAATTADTVVFIRPPLRSKTPRSYRRPWRTCFGSVEPTTLAGIGQASRFDQITEVDQTTGVEPVEITGVEPAGSCVGSDSEWIATPDSRASGDRR